MNITKQSYQAIFSFLLKVFFTLGAFYFLFQQISIKELPHNLWQNISVVLLLLMLILSMLNWFFEIKKWQVLVGNVQKICFKQAAKQSLMSFSVSLLTPNRVGEWGAKSLFYKPDLYKKIFSLSVIGSMTQMIMSLVFGIIGIVISIVYFPDFVRFFSLTNYKNLWIVLLFLLFIGFVWFLKNKYKSLIFDAVIWKQAAFYAFVRYVIFSTQFLIVLLYFQHEDNYLQVLTGIYLTYFIATLIPMLSFFDWAVKGSVAVFVFHDLIPAEIVLQSVGIMWIFNFFIPFLIGSLYIYNQNFSLLKK